MLALEPENADAAHYLGLVYLRQRKLDQARTMLESATRWRPGYSQSYYQLAQVYQRLGEEKKAEAALGAFHKLAASEKVRSQKAYPDRRRSAPTP